MKVETRGKFPGVKLHLEPEEVQLILEHAPNLPGNIPPTQDLLRKMNKKIRQLMEENPSLLSPRTPEEIAAILIKESEKSAQQLAHLKATGSLEKLDQQSLKSKLLSYVKEA